MTAAPTAPDDLPSGRIGRLGARLPEGLVDAAWIWLVLRIGLGLIALFLVMREQAASACVGDDQLAFLPDQGPLYTLFGTWLHWDACWYSTIAALGYGSGAGATTFFPLLPMLLGGLAGLRGNIVFVGPAITAIACIAAFTGLRQLVARDVDTPTAKRTVLYTAVFPSAFFLIAPFTESLFLATAVWAFLGARRRRWEIVLVAGLLAGLTRPQGLLLVLPLGWEAFQMLRARWAAGGPRLRLTDAGVGLAVASPLIAYAAFVAWTAIVVGRSYFASHVGWGEHELILPWDRLAQGIQWSIDNGEPLQSLNAVAWVGFVGLAVAAIRLLPVSYWLYAVPQLALMLTQHTVFPLMSTMRYLVVLFPCFVILAMAGRHERFNTAWLVLSTLLLGFFASLFVQGVMVG